MFLLLFKSNLPLLVTILHFWLKLRHLFPMHIFNLFNFNILLIMNLLSVAFLLIFQEANLLSQLRFLFVSQAVFGRAFLLKEFAPSFPLTFKIFLHSLLLVLHSCVRYLSLILHCWVSLSLESFFQFRNPFLKPLASLLFHFSKLILKLWLDLSNLILMLIQ